MMTFVNASSVYSKKFTLPPEHVSGAELSGAENGAERAKTRVEWSGERVTEKGGGAERYRAGTEWGVD